jgi:hypothetical protein
LNFDIMVNMMKKMREICLSLCNYYRHKGMKVLLDIKDKEAAHLMKVLESLPYVKAKPLTDVKAHLMSEIKDAVEEMKLIRAGKKKTRNAEDFLNEL